VLFATGMNASFDNRCLCVWLIPCTFHA
jgi:hypothetical protein